MEVIYVCQYCGNLFKAKTDALDCEKKAEKNKPKFKIGEVVYDEDDYKYRVIKRRRWKRSFLNLYSRCIFGGESELIVAEIPADHCFEYILVGIDAENKDRKIVLKENELRIEKNDTKPSSKPRLS